MNHDSQDMESSDSAAASSDALSDAPLPFDTFVALAALQLSEAWNIVMLFPFLLFLVKDILPASLQSQTGFYTGIIGSMWSLGQVVSSSLWGYFSDIYGRRPTLLIGTFGVILISPFFGLSSTLFQAASTRFIGGLLNGNVAIIKSVVGDCTNKVNQARGFSILALMWGIGSTIGPTAAGLLCKPGESTIARQFFPDFIHPHSILITFPYLLPCLVQSLVATLAFIVTFFILDETRWTSVNNNNNQLNQHSTVNHNASIVDNTEAMKCTALFGLVALTWIIHDETFPLFCASPVRSGGLGLNASEIGIILSSSGITLILFQFFVFPPLCHRFGILLLFRTSCFISSLTFLLVPISGIFMHSGYSRSAFTWCLFCITLRTSCACICFTCVFMLINNSVQDVNTRGKINGIAQTVASIARTIGPFIAGMLWSIAVQSQNSLRFHQWIPFLASSTSITCAWFISFKLDPALDAHK